MTTEKQQTPLQKLIEYMRFLDETDADDKLFLISQKTEELLPEEKQMVIDAHFNGMVDKKSDDFIGRERTGEQYFNETFK